MIGVGQRLSRSDRWSGQLHHTNLGLVKDSLGMTCVQSSVLTGLLLAFVRCLGVLRVTNIHGPRSQVLVSAH